MTKREQLLKQIEEEYGDFLNQVEKYDVEEIMYNSAMIAKMKAMYDYLTLHDPMTDEMVEHFVKLTKPLETICRRYNPLEEETHEEFMTVISDIAERKEVLMSRKYVVLEAADEPQGGMDLC